MTHIGSGYTVEIDAAFAILSSLTKSRPNDMRRYDIFIKVRSYNGIAISYHLYIQWHSNIIIVCLYVHTYMYVQSQNGCFSLI